MSEFTLLSRALPAQPKSRKRPRPDQYDAARLDALLGEQGGSAQRRLGRALALGGRATASTGRDFGAIAHAITAVAARGGRVHVLAFDENRLHIERQLASVLGSMGISCARIRPHMTVRSRVRAYQAQAVLVSAQDAALDFLRGRLAGDVQQGLRRGFSKLGPSEAAAQLPQPIDIDLVLVLDGEDTLIERSLAGIVLTGKEESESSVSLTSRDVLGVATQFGANDFRFREGEAELTTAGRDRLSLLTSTMGLAWSNPARAELAVRAGLACLHMWCENEDFVVRDGEVEVGDLLAARPVPIEALEPEYLLRARLRIGEAKERAPALDRIPLRAALRKFPRMSVFVRDLDRHAAELEQAYGLKSLGRSPKPSAECCLHLDYLSDMVQPVDGDWVVLSGGRQEEAAALRMATGLPIEWPAPSVPPDRIPRAVVSMGGHTWPDWALAPGVRRILVPVPDKDALEPGLVVRIAHRYVWLVPLRRFLFQVRDQKKISADRQLRRRLFEFDRSCRNAVTILGNYND
ncbi:hypothetical protein [uncultured Maritimibacter sp.]|uniref:hypothetical protein n=1 Tax=uncultured Maritimibacter sp. TaxID=991866 RepID=UPI0026ABEB5B|tara:strand:- start:17682 stop:19241 length:1560 start_codon:yes stop_codon:yes gene_type:complete